MPEIMSRDIAKALRTEFTPENPLPVAGSGGSAGSASATSSNQETQITRETEIRDAINTLLTEGTDITGVAIPIGGAGGRGWLSAIWKLISDIWNLINNRLPSALVGDRIKVEATQSTSWNVNVLSAPTNPLIYGAGTQNIDTTSLLSPGAMYIGVPRNTSLLRSSVIGWILTNQPGTLIIEQSTDNTTWRKIFSLNVIAKIDPTTYEAKLYAQYYRLKFTNTGTAAQTVMQLISNTYNNNASSATTSDATAANQVTGNTTLAAIANNTPALGQATASGSTPVVLPSAQITALTPPTTLSGITNTVTVKADTPANQTNAFKVDGSAITQPVSGNVTFSNSTIGISGTLPSFTSTPTFKVDQTTPGTTNKVSIGNDGIIGVGGTVAVTGTFYQATQPVSFGSLPAGTNAIGSITNTVFPSSQSGTWNVGINSLPALTAGTNTIGSINNISGVISLPTGAALDSTSVAIRDRLPPALVNNRLAVDVGVTQFEITNDIGNPIPVNGSVKIADQTTATLASIKSASTRSQFTDTAIVIDQRDIAATITAITTDGTSGDKVILTPTTGKALRISSLYFLSTAATPITLKSGSTTISGAMNLISHAADYGSPVSISVGQNFVINIGSAIAINGYVVWWEV